MEVPDKCPRCNAVVEQLKDGTGSFRRYNCGSVFWFHDESLAQTQWCTLTERDILRDRCATQAQELANLKDELKAKSECMEGALSDCHELIKQIANLEARVKELEVLITLGIRKHKTRCVVCGTIKDFPLCDLPQCSTYNFLNQARTLGLVEGE